MSNMKVLGKLVPSKGSPPYLTDGHLLIMSSPSRKKRGSSMDSSFKGGNLITRAPLTLITSSKFYRLKAPIPKYDHIGGSCFNI